MKDYLRSRRRKYDFLFLHGDVLKSRDEFLVSENMALTQKLLNAELEIPKLESKLKATYRSPVKGGFGTSSAEENDGVNHRYGGNKKCKSNNKTSCDAALPLRGSARLKTRNT